MQASTLTLFLLFTSVLSFAQTDGPSSKTAMEKLSFLAGKWSGSGWQMNQQRQKMAFTQTEDIEFLTDGESLLIKGLGKSNNPETGEERVIHNAVALITYDPEEDRYDFRSFVVGRGSGNHIGHLVADGHFEWFLETPNGKIRYTITINEKGQWHEIGEFAMGDSWFQFFEMTLDKL
ncbi:MAG: hypothetical protein R2824_31340 [Saprospiraceae bacterium]|nr:hypothetical protein [Lewinella sp.]